jgi:hypothetical protein
MRNWPWTFAPLSLLLQVDRWRYRQCGEGPRDGEVLVISRARFNW